MVRLHVKRGGESQFLLEAPGSARLAELAPLAARIHNGLLKVQRLCSEMEELAEHGISLPYNMQGLTDEQITELKLKDEWAEKCVPSGGSVFRKDEMGRRNGFAPNEKMQQVIKKTIEEAKALISKIITESQLGSFGRDLKAHPVPPHCHGQGHFPLDQVAQSSIQPGLEHFQGWGRVRPWFDKRLDSCSVLLSVFKDKHKVCPHTDGIVLPGIRIHRIAKSRQVQANVCVNMETVKEALEQLRGAVMIVYPMGLPPHDPIRMELEDKEDLSGTHAGTEVIKESEAQLWWAGKQLEETKLLSDYVGKNEKTTIIVKIQKKGQGAPGREPVISHEEQKEMMLYYHRRQEELKKLEEEDDDSFLNAEWADNHALKRQFHGVKDIKWGPR